MKVAATAPASPSVIVTSSMERLSAWRASGPTVADASGAASATRSARSAGRRIIRYWLKKVSEKKTADPEECHGPNEGELLAVVLEHDGHPVPRDDIRRDEREAEDEQRRDGRRRHERHGIEHGFVGSAAFKRRPPELTRALIAPRGLALSRLRGAAGGRTPRGRGGAALLLQALRLLLRGLGPGRRLDWRRGSRPRSVPDAGGGPERRRRRRLAAEAAGCTGGWRRRRSTAEAAAAVVLTGGGSGLGRLRTTPQLRPQPRALPQGDQRERARPRIPLIVPVLRTAAPPHLM